MNGMTVLSQGKDVSRRLRGKVNDRGKKMAYIYLENDIDNDAAPEKKRGKRSENAYRQHTGQWTPMQVSVICEFFSSLG